MVDDISGNPLQDKLTGRMEVNQRYTTDLGESYLERFGERATARYVKALEAVNSLFGAIYEDPASSENVVLELENVISSLSAALVDGDSSQRTERFSNIAASNGKLSGLLRDDVEKVGGTAGPNPIRDGSEDRL